MFKLVDGILPGRNHFLKEKLAWRLRRATSCPGISALQLKGRHIIYNKAAKHSRFRDCLI